MRIKNWSRFQHYSDRNPTWIKLHLSILNDMEVQKLPSDVFKTLIGLWLVASETAKDGKLPASEVLEFRLRIPKKTIEEHISLLGQWLESDASIVLADCKQNGGTENTERKLENTKQREEGRLSAEWIPDEKAKKIAKERGMSETYLAIVADKFRDHADSHDWLRADWNAAFCKWLRYEKLSDGISNGRVSTLPPLPAWYDTVQSRRVRMQ